MHHCPRRLPPPLLAAPIGETIPGAIRRSGREPKPATSPATINAIALRGAVDARLAIRHDDRRAIRHRRGTPALKASNSPTIMGSGRSPFSAAARFSANCAATSSSASACLIASAARWRCLAREAQACWGCR